MQVLGGVGVPVVAAPMAGGASTPELVAAVAAAGGLGFLAAGYRGAEAMAGQIARVRSRTGAPFGVNVFVPGPDDADPAAVEAYRARIAPEAARLGAEPGTPRWSDDDFDAKVDALLADPVPLVGFTFGCPQASAVAALRRAGSAVVVTVTDAAEARAAVEAGADALCVQGAEAGGHQGSFDDAEERTAPLAEVLAAVRAAVDVPLIAAGGITGAVGVRAVLASGAIAAQMGTAFLRAPESGANATHKNALADGRFTATAVTRAFSGRRARGLANRFMADHGAAAPAAYPHVHHLTGPLRAAAARAGDADSLHLWAGTGHRAAAERPAAEIVTEIARGL
ncbi:nitronate monooxygenase [Spinactinospora alkalitolerans]|uniref:Probable nitronate monooxygenase n=1 Tax=Spinactinospora alkalitolerans TaxID=687207 RepID=A0A852TWJ4_9ACTN|nr:nitronate monooxygenase [Spinactinospora alkalitolerans]NYE47687.1 nitronate monooxygenase [Spinactinospora alkalitolerans]